MFHTWAHDVRQGYKTAILDGDRESVAQYIQRANPTIDSEQTYAVADGLTEMFRAFPETRASYLLLLGRAPLLTHLVEEYEVYAKAFAGKSSLLSWLAAERTTMQALVPTLMLVESSSSLLAPDHLDTIIRQADRLEAVQPHFFNLVDVLLRVDLDDDRLDDGWNGGDEFELYRIEDGESGDDVEEDGAFLFKIKRLVGRQGADARLTAPERLKVRSARLNTAMETWRRKWEVLWGLARRAAPGEARTSLHHLLRCALTNMVEDLEDYCECTRPPRIVVPVARRPGFWSTS